MRLIRFRLSAAAVGLCWAAFAARPLEANELICLRSGFCFQAVSHSTANERVTLQMGTGSVEVATADIVSVEEAKVAVPAPAASTSAMVKVAGAGKAEPNAQVLLRDAADAQGLDGDFLRSVAQAESGLKNTAVSPKGALGLMQLMPGTAKEVEVNPALPADNALGGAKYLRALLLRYHSNSALALAAYNAGPGAVDKYHGVPPYAETQAYVRRVTREYDRLHSAAATATASKRKASSPKANGATTSNKAGGR